VVSNTGHQSLFLAYLWCTDWCTSGVHPHRLRDQTLLKSLSFWVSTRAGCPSWTLIELCVSPRRPIFGGCFRRFEKAFVTAMLVPNIRESPEHESDLLVFP
jgi:hypothetical protein